MFNEIREILEKLNLPSADSNNLPSSNKRFGDGGHFRIEIPSTNSLSFLETVMNESKRLGVKINRVTETYGMFRHTEDEIEEMVALCASAGYEFIMSIGPRATYDTSATAGSSQGKTVAYRLRGMEQIVRAIADVYRGLCLGVKSFLVYDEGLLMVLGEMRKQKYIAQDITFKVSAHCGHGNPASFRLLEQLGASSINPVRDLDLPMLAALRQTVDVPIDCHTDTPSTSGGFIRTYEAPEMVRIAAPVYLKVGTSALTAHGTKATKEIALNMVRQAVIILEMVTRYYPTAIQSDI